MGFFQFDSLQDGRRGEMQKNTLPTQLFFPWDLMHHLRPDQASCALGFLQIEKWG
jgi:hypothetical protein